MSQSVISRYIGFNQTTTRKCLSKALKLQEEQSIFGFGQVFTNIGGVMRKADDSSTGKTILPLLVKTNFGFGQVFTNNRVVMKKDDDGSTGKTILPQLDKTNQVFGNDAVRGFVVPSKKIQILPPSDFNRIKLSEKVRGKQEKQMKTPSQGKENFNEAGNKNKEAINQKNMFFKRNPGQVVLTRRHNAKEGRQKKDKNRQNHQETEIRCIYDGIEKKRLEKREQEKPLHLPVLGYSNQIITRQAEYEAERKKAERAKEKPRLIVPEKYVRAKRQEGAMEKAKQQKEKDQTMQAAKPVPPAWKPLRDQGTQRKLLLEAQTCEAFEHVHKAQQEEIERARRRMEKKTLRMKLDGKGLGYNY